MLSSSATQTRLYISLLWLGAVHPILLNISAKTQFLHARCVSSAVYHRPAYQQQTSCRGFLEVFSTWSSAVWLRTGTFKLRGRSTRDPAAGRASATVGGAPGQQRLSRAGLMRRLSVAYPWWPLWAIYFGISLSVRACFCRKPVPSLFAGTCLRNNCNRSHYQSKQDCRNIVADPCEDA